MSNNQELVMETTHGRSKKCKTEFKAVLNKVLVSGLVLATMLGTATPAFAAELSIKEAVDAVNGGYSNSNSNITQEYGVSVESAIQNIRNTIQAIENMKANGIVSDSQIKELASQLYSLESAVLADEGVTSDVVSVLNSAENAIKGLSNASKAEVALAVVRSNLGIDSVTVSNKSDVNTTNASGGSGTSDSELKSFSDIKIGHWAYNAIIDMSIGNHAGLFGGTSKVVNGVGTFSPSDKMTRAQFIAVVIRAMYPNELAAKNGRWDLAAYEVALDKGILKESEFGGSENLGVAMNRQEMAMVLVRACESKGEYPSQLVSTSRIADYDKVGDYYQDYVVEAFSMGLLQGKDTKGTYHPTETMDRAQGATVLYRLVEPSTREKVDFSVPTTPDISGPITIYEGQPRVLGESRLAREGDTVIKADGTKVILKKGPSGVLGEGQGVAPDLGFKTSATATGNFIVINQAPFTNTDGLVDSLGNTVNNSRYMVNPWTGEGHFSSEWGHLTDLHPQPTEPGTKDLQLSEDNIWVWDGVLNEWFLAANCGHIPGD